MRLYWLGLLVACAPAACNDVLGIAPTQIEVLPKLTSACGEISVVATGQKQVIAMVADDAALYWINQGDGTIREAKQGKVTVIAPTEPTAKSIAINGSNVYWSASFTEIRVWPRSGAADPSLFLFVQNASPGVIAVDSANLYFADNEKDGGIVRVSLSDTTSVRLASQVYYPTSIALDTRNVYYGASALGEAPTDGGPSTTLVRNTSISDLFADGKAVYWAGGGSNVATRYDLDAGVQKSIGSLGDNHAIVVDPNYAYVSAGQDHVPDGKIVRVPNQGGDPTVCASQLRDTGPLAIDSQHVYFTSRSASGIDTVYAIKL